MYFKLENNNLSSTTKKSISFIWLSTSIVAKEEIPLILSKVFIDELFEIKKNKITHTLKLIILFAKNIFFDKLYMWFVKNIDKETNATAAQLALALTKMLSPITIKNTGREKDSKNFVSKLYLILFKLSKKKTKKRGPIIMPWLKTNSPPWNKLKFILFREALSDVWLSVTQLFFIFQIKFGKRIIKDVPRKRTKWKIFLKNIFLIFSSKKSNIIKDGKKYIAAYFAKKDNPKKIPKSKKLISFGFFLTLIKNNRDKDQNKIKITSVDIKKEDTLTAGKR